MKHEDLKDRISQAINQGLLLEAFLIQSSYIEGIFSLYVELNLKTILDPQATITASTNEQYLKETLKDRIGKYGFEALIDFMYDSELINKDEKILFDKYRSHRNQFIHHLLDKISIKATEQDLVSTLEIGNTIIKNNKFKFIANLFRITEQPLLRTYDKPNYFSLKNKKQVLRNSEKEIKIVQMRLSGMKLAEIGKMYNITRERVRQLLNKGLEHFYGKAKASTEIIKVKMPKGNTPKIILNSIAEQFEINMTELLNQRRKKEFVFPRHLAMYLLRKNSLAQLSFPQIARLMRKEDHTTVMYACEKIDSFVKKGKILFVT